MTYEKRVRNPYAREELRRRRRRKRFYRRLTVLSIYVFLTIGVILLLGKVFLGKTDRIISEAFSLNRQEADWNTQVERPEITENFLTVNEYSRPGNKLCEVKDIFVHYTANPGTNAAQNRSYFENLSVTHERSASAHFIIGYEGEILQCIPLEEIAYAVKTRNYDSISIECCYVAQDGSFTQETYDSLIALLAWLTEGYHLNENQILRHYDCGGKKCPLYYVEHEDAWAQLKKDVLQKRTEAEKK